VGLKKTGLLGHEIGLFLVLFVGPAGFKSEGIFRLPIAIPYAPAQGSGDGGIGSLFALNPDVKGGGANLQPTAWRITAQFLLGIKCL